MILYHASTMYHLLCCIVHKLAYHPDDDAELLMLEYIKPDKNRKAFLKQVLDSGFFATARYVPEQKFKLKKGNALDDTSNEKEIKAVIENISKTFESWFDEDITKFDEIYVASDQHSLGIYLTSKGIPYHYFEDASGMLSEQSRYISITKSNNMTNHIINEYLGCMGRSSCVKSKLCDLRHQQKGFYDEKAEDFCIYDILKFKIPDKVQEIINFFGDIPHKIRGDKKICLYLTQDLNTLKIKDLDLQELMMTTLVDYMCGDEYVLVVKPHPKDRWQNYRRIFSDCILLEKSEPSELLPFVIDREVDIALTASSTSIRGVDKFAIHSYCFTTDIETNRERIDDMYVAALLLKELEVNNIGTIRNINEIQITNLLNRCGIILDNGNVLIDGGMKKNDNLDVYDYKLSILLNLGNIINFNADIPTDGLYIITADFLPKGTSLMREKQLMIFAYTRDKEIQSRLESLIIRKQLKYTQADIAVRCKKADSESIERLKAKLARDIEWEE